MLRIECLMQSKYRTIIIVAVPIIKSTITHLMNPIGFPAGMSYDEATYIERSMRMLNSGGPQENPTSYDHPYFVQIFLSSLFSFIGYPNLFNSGANLQSIENLYLVPRLITIILSIVDTWLIFKISESRYNRKVAFIASIFFAVTPLSSYLRRAWLEPIQLSFLLSSILFALYAQRYASEKKLGFVAISEIFVGLSIFT